MTPQEMADAASAALRAGQRITLMRRGRAPKGFPRGELLSEHYDGRRAYSYDPQKILAWLDKHRLIGVEVLR